MERLYKNFGWMAAANITGSLFTAVLFIYLARTLQPEYFGYLSYALTFVYFINNFVDLGLSTYGVREVAKDKKRISDYVSEIVSFRLIVASALSTVVLLALAALFRLSPLNVLMSESLLLVFVFALGAEWAFQGVEKMNMTFISYASSSGLQLLLVFIFVKKPEDAYKVPWLFFAAAMPVLLLFLAILKFKLKIKKPDFKRMVGYLSSSIVIWSIAVCAQIYNNFDIFILGIFRRPEELGCFTIAKRVVGSVALLMVFLANAVLPKLSSSFCQDSEQFRAATRNFLKIAGMIAITILIPVLFFSEKAIALTVGVNYISAAAPLKIMVVGLVFIILNIPFSTGLIACGLEKEVLKQAMASTALSLILNFILIPKYGMIGASVSFVSAEALALMWILWIYERKIKHKLTA